MSIVQVNVSQIVAANPNTLQQTGGVISQGGTTLTAGQRQLLTQRADLTPLLRAPLAVSSISYSSGTVSVQTAVNIPGIVSGDLFLTTLSGFTPIGYNGLVLATATSPNTFTFPLASDPGIETVLGTYTPPNSSELVSRITNYFGQGNNQSVWVLELGPADGHTGPPLLDTWIQNNQKQIYHFRVPSNWDGTDEYKALLANYEADNAMVYFWEDTTVLGRTQYTPQMKSAHILVNSPSKPLAEDSESAPFASALSYNPNASSRMTPFANKFLYGVTPWPIDGNQSTLALLTGRGTVSPPGYYNYVGTAAEGGISTADLEGGTMMDGNDFSFWFAADWAQIWGALVLANEVKNGANNPANPLWFDQDGINRLQDRVVKQYQAGVGYSILQGSVTRTQLDQTTFINNFNDDVYANQCVVNAIPFSNYTALNPGDYQEGRYAGLTSIVIPKRGFRAIIFALVVSSLIAP